MARRQLRTSSRPNRRRSSHLLGTNFLAAVEENELVDDVLQPRRFSFQG
jgi:hypothetical protein